MHLFLIMVVVTSIEVVLIAKVGSIIGFWMTLFIIIVTAIIGSYQLKKQWRLVTSKLSSLQGNPSETILEALVLLISGVFLITPGFLTDAVGFLGLVPAVRKSFVNIIRKNQSKFIKGVFNTSYNRSNTYERHTDSSYKTKAGDKKSIIEGEYEHKDN